MIDHCDGKWAGTVFRDIDDDDDDEDDDGDWHCTSVCFHGPFPPVALATKSGPIHTHNLTFAAADDDRDAHQVGAIHTHTFWPLLMLMMMVIIVMLTNSGPAIHTP